MSAVEEQWRSVGDREIGRERNFKGSTLRRTRAVYGIHRTKQRSPYNCDLWHGLGA